MENDQRHRKDYEYEFSDKRTMKEEKQVGKAL
jgi:hypothetical protein